MHEAGLRINYFISGHGFGHATRSARLIEALLDAEPAVYITVITTAPNRFFPRSERVVIKSQDVDSAIIQPQPYSIDAIATFVDLGRFLRHVDSDEWQANAKALFRESECHLILADAPCPFAWFGHAPAVPSILVSNFSFDAIFDRLMAYMPQCGTVIEKSMISRLERVYSSYDYLVRLPGYIDFPFVQTHWAEQKQQSRVIDAPLVFRPPKSSREGTFHTLGIPTSYHIFKILLVQFGGQSVTLEARETPELPSGWICLSSIAVDDPRFFTFPKDVYSPDLVALSDAVLGKIGYGTVSECVGLAKPLVYVRRPMFAEEPGLLRYMEKHGTCAEISVDEYESGSWADTISHAYETHSAAQLQVVPEGSASLAKTILRIVSTKGREELERQQISR